MRAAFFTLGCKTNAYETQAVLEQFRQAGFEIGEFGEPNDVYVINTCAVTKEASRKSRQMIGRCKRINPDAFVVVTGCYVQEAADEILKNTGADIVVGNSEKAKIIDILNNREDRKHVKDLSRCREYEEQTISDHKHHVRAYVKIQDGCDRFCSYCLIPYLRGRSRSRDKNLIISEAERLAGSGMKEIVLTGIDISSYDDGIKDDGLSLSRLIRDLGTIEGIERIRLGSLEVNIVSEELLRELKDIGKFCPQFHLSLQSGSDTVLERMNRKYSTESYKNAVKLIRNTFPSAGITTDVIAGFPGETEEEHLETKEFVREMAFSRMHVFPYSRREKTRADKMPGQLSAKIKEERAGSLIAAGEEMRKEYEERLIDSCCEILAEEYVSDPHTGRTCVCGYTPEYVRIFADVSEYPGELTGKIIKVVPEEYKNGVLTGIIAVFP